MVSPEPVRRNPRHRFNMCETSVLTIVSSRRRTARVKLYLYQFSILFLRFPIVSLTWWPQVAGVRGK